MSSTDKSHNNIDGANSFNAPYDSEAPDHSPTKHTIVLIHGLYQNRLIMRTLGKRLERLNYNILFFDYSTLLNSMSENIENLRSFLKSKSVQSPYTLIGHSLGCLVSYYTIKTLYHANLQAPLPDTTYALPSSVIAITPPFQGSRIVQYLDQKQSAFLVGKAKTVLLPEDSKLQWDFQIPLGVIAGTHNSGPSQLLLEKITQYLPEDTLISDGTVYLDETMISGLQDFITLPKSHTMILFDPKLPTLCDHFIRFGTFE